MRALRFHREIYRGEYVDEAVKVYQRFASFTTREEAEHWVVEVAGRTPERERQVALELANYALGLTIKNRGKKA